MARRTQWFTEADGQTVGTGTTANFDLLADAEVAKGINFAGWTVTRVIGSIFLRSLVVPAADTIQEVAFGMGVFTQNLAASSHPNPRNENHNWMWWRVIRFVPWTVEASAGVFRQLMIELPFDTRTQRILKSTEDRLEMTISVIQSESV